MDEKQNNQKKIVDPSILSGFMELLPKEQMILTHMTDTIKKTFESYGFIPLDTPVLEKSEGSSLVPVDGFSDVSGNLSIASV